MPAIASEPPAPASAASTAFPEDIFLNACVHGQVRLNSKVAEKIDWPSAPKSLRWRKNDFSEPMIFQINKPRLSYLIVGSDFQNPAMRRCALASRKFDQRKIWDALIKLGLPEGAMPNNGDTTTMSMTYEASDGADARITVGFDHFSDGMRYVQTISARDRLGEGK